MGCATSTTAAEAYRQTPRESRAGGSASASSGRGSRDAQPPVHGDEGGRGKAETNGGEEKIFKVLNYIYILRSTAELKVVRSRSRLSLPPCVGLVHCVLFGFGKAEKYVRTAWFHCCFVFNFFIPFSPCPRRCTIMTQRKTMTCRSVTETCSALPTTLTATGGKRSWSQTRRAKATSPRTTLPLSRRQLRRQRRVLKGGGRGRQVLKGEWQHRSPR